MVPHRIEAGGEQLADAGEHVQVEERVAVGVGGGKLLGKEAVGADLRADGGRFVAMHAVGENLVVVQVARHGRNLQQPGRGVVVACVAHEQRGAVLGKVGEVAGEPVGELGVEVFGERQEGKRDHDLGKRGAVGDIERPGRGGEAKQKVGEQRGGACGPGRGLAGLDVCRGGEHGHIECEREQIGRGGAGERDRGGGEDADAVDLGEVGPGGGRLGFRWTQAGCGGEGGGCDEETAAVEHGQVGLRRSLACLGWPRFVSDRNCRRCPAGAGDCSHDNLSSASVIMGHPV